MSKIAATLLACLLALSCNTNSPKFAFQSAEIRGTLESNGLRFVIMPDATTQLAEVDVHYDVGSREDPEGKAGLAHLVEHLMFQTRPDGPETPPIFQTIIDLAVGFNAFTNWDMTHYYTTVRAEHLDDMLKIEAMRMFYAADLPPFGCSTLKESEFEREREVVRNEIRAGSSADNYVVQLVEKDMYPNGHAYQRLVGGDDQQIASASLKDACEFMKKYYAPERATVVVAGGVDVKQAEDLIQKWFGKLPRRTPAPRVDVAPFTPAHAQHEVLADVERPSLWIGWALPPRNTPEGEYAYFGIGQAFARIATKGREYGFAYKVEPAILGGELAPLFLVHIELKGLDKVDDAMDFAEKAAKQAYRGYDEGTWEEFEEAKNRAKAQFVADLEQLPARTLEVSRMVQFEKDFDFNSHDQYLFHQLDKFEKYDNSKIGAVVKKTLDWNKAGFVLVKPSAEGIKGDTRSKVKFEANKDAAFTNAVFDPKEAHRPLKVSAELKALAAAKRFKLDNGLNVVLLQVKAMPVAAASLTFKNVGDANTPDDPMLGASAARFLSLRPDVDPNMTENIDAYSRTGIDIGCDSGPDETTCSTHGVNLYVDIMIKGLERIITAGYYSQARIESWQKEVREDFKLKSTQEEVEYRRQVYTGIYGPEHPYTRTAFETPDTAGKIHLDALNSYRRKHFTAANATLIVVGNFDLDYAEKIAREAFGGWDAGTLDKPVDPKPFKRTGPMFVGVTKAKEDQQVTVTIAYPAPAGVDGQEGARRVLSAMMNTRAENVRFKRGSTYGLYFARRPHIGPSSYILRGGAVVGGTVDAERAGESIKAIRDSLDDMRKGDDEWDEDFVRARRTLLGQLLGESTVTTELAQRLGFIAEFGLDANYYNTLMQQIAAVSPAQIRALIKSELDPGNEVVVLLGDRAHLEKAFADAGITDVKIVEPEYK